MTRRVKQMTGAGIVLLLLSACATTGQRYQVALSYQANASAAQKNSFSDKVVVFPLEDLRRDPGIIGHRTHLFGQNDTYETAFPAGQKIAQLLVDSLRQKGFDAILAAEGERPGSSGGNQIVTGKIQGLSADAHSHLGHTQIDAHVNLLLEIFNRHTGGMTTIAINEEYSPNVFIFYPELLEKNLNELLSNGLNDVRIGRSAMQVS